MKHLCDSTTTKVTQRLFSSPDSGIISFTLTQIEMNFHLWPVTRRISEFARAKDFDSLCMLFFVKLENVRGSESCAGENAFRRQLHSRELTFFTGFVEKVGKEQELTKNFYMKKVCGGIFSSLNWLLICFNGENIWWYELGDFTVVLLTVLFS